MKEWISQNLETIVYIGAALASLVTGSGIFSAIIAFKASKELHNRIEKARKAKYWTTCPRCKNTISLDEVRWHMPDGKVDDDFDGKED